MIFLEHSFVFETAEMLLVTMARTRDKHGSRVHSKMIGVDKALAAVVKACSELLGQECSVEAPEMGTGELH